MFTINSFGTNTIDSSDINTIKYRDLGWLRSIAEISDGNYITVGYMYGSTDDYTSLGSFDAVMIKYDANGTYTFKATDMVGNIGTLTVKTNIGKNLPTLNIENNQNWTNTDVKVSITC